MKTGIIGYGSMGKMLLEKISRDLNNSSDLLVTNRTRSKIPECPNKYTIIDTAEEVAAQADIVFLCLRPDDLLNVSRDIAPVLREDTLLVSLNGSITFDMLESIVGSRRLAKMIPSVTAETDRSQTLVCFGGHADDTDKELLRGLVLCMGSVIELPENEMGMGSELVSCMPGFIAAMFDVVCCAAKKHTSLPDEMIADMVLNTVSATADLMLSKEMSFRDVVARVATKGGITEVGADVIYKGFPQVAEEMFEKTLEKRRQTALLKQH